MEECLLTTAKMVSTKSVHDGSVYVHAIPSPFKQSRAPQVSSSKPSCPR